MQKHANSLPKLANFSRRTKATISLTPLIDVVFILLVFFMLASNFMDWNSIALDGSSANEAESFEGPAFLVQVGTDTLQLNGTTIGVVQLIEQAMLRQPMDQLVLVQPLANTSVQSLVTLLDALNAVGIHPLKLVEDPQWQPEGRMFEHIGKPVSHPPEPEQ